MPDGMSPENPNVPISPSVQAIRRTGPSPEQIRQFQDPEWKSELPDIRMQLGGEGQDDQRNIMDIIRALSGRAATSGLEKFSNGLQSYFQDKDDIVAARKALEGIQGSGVKLTKDDAVELRKFIKWEKENNPEKLQQKYNRTLEQMMGVVDDVFRVSIDQQKNAYPYDHRTAELTVHTIIETAQALQEEEWAQNPEAKVWLKRMESDAKWMGDLLQVTVAESASAPFYWDVLSQMRILEERFKATVTSENLQGLNSKEIPGLSFDQNELQIIKQNGVGLSVPSIYQRHEVNLTEGKNIGLRELGVKMRDESFAIRMRMAAVSQVDFSLPNTDTETFMGINLKPEEQTFYKELLWTEKFKDGEATGEGFVLAPHMVSKGDEKKEISAKLEAMLVTNAHGRLNKIMNGDLGEFTSPGDAINGLLTEVKDEAKRRIDGWEARGKDIVSQLAMLITKQGLYEDYALLHVYRYCWQFIWNVDRNHNILSKKKVDTAGIYSYSGDAYSLHYMKRAFQYDRNANSRTQFLLPSSKAGRAEVELYRYDQMAQFNPDEISLNDKNERKPENLDKFMKDQWNFLFGTDDNSKAARRAMGYQDIHESVAGKIKSWATKWRVPYSSKYVEDGTDYELTVPMFMPPGLDVANFLEAIKDIKGEATVWKKLVGGKKLSEIEWKKLEKTPFDRWYVDLDMAYKYMHLLIEVFEKERDPVFSLISGEPGTLGPKELAKRLRLTFRDSGEARPEDYEVAFIPFLVTLACAEKHNIMSSGGWRRTTKTDFATSSIGVERFLLEMADWKRAFKWLPSDRPETDLLKYNTPQYEVGKPGDRVDAQGYKLDDQGQRIDLKWNYGNTMALITEFYEAVLLRVGKASAEDAFALGKSNYSNTSARVNKMPFIGRGRLTDKINQNLIPND